LRHVFAGPKKSSQLTSRILFGKKTWTYLQWVIYSNTYKGSGTPSKAPRCLDEVG